jgi:hypothetical protein
MTKESGTNVNAKVLQIVEQSAGIDETARRARLSRYTTWTADDLREFEEGLAAQRVIDVRLWT